MAVNNLGTDIERRKIGQVAFDFSVSVVLCVCVCVTHGTGCSFGTVNRHRLWQSELMERPVSDFAYFVIVDDAHL